LFGVIYGDVFSNFTFFRSDLSFGDEIQRHDSRFHEGAERPTSPATEDSWETQRSSKQAQTIYQLK
jgi:hypothetical protein